MDYSCPACKHPLDPQSLQTPDDETGDFGDVTMASCPHCGTQLSGMGQTLTFQSSVELDGDKSIAHFALVRQLGQGGFGTVWLAEDRNLGRQVALKLPSTGDGVKANLPHEAKTAAKLKHPNIVSVYEIGSDGDQPYIASEFIDGLNLQDSLSIKKPSVARTVELMIAIANALDHAHSNGVVHRDIKPANILLNADGQPFVTDFGIAKQISTEATISSDGQIIGTMRYMSPEQAAGRTHETDRRSDIYALGVILFEMVTGDRPFRGNARALIQQKLNEDPPSPRKLDATIPKDIETICLKCLERDPAKRYQTAHELVEELQRFDAGKPILARPVSTVEKTWRWCQRRPAVAGLLATTIASLSLGLVGVSFFGLQAQRSANESQMSLYRSRMNLAREYWGRGDIGAIRTALAPYRRGHEASRLRGFAWYYYDHLLAPFEQVVNHGDVVTDVSISNDGRLFASNGTDRKVQVWDAKSGDHVRTLELRAGQIQSICFSPSSGLLASGSSDGMIRIWQPLQNDRPILEFKHGPAVQHVIYSHDGKTLAAAGNAGPVRLWDASSGELRVAFPAGAFLTQCIRFSAKSEMLAVATQDGRVRLWDVASETALHVLEPNPGIESLAFINDGQQLVTGCANGDLRVWSIATGEHVETYSTAAGIVGDLEYIRKPSVLAVIGVNGRTLLIDTVEKKMIKSINTHNLANGMLGQSRLGKTLVVGSGDGSVKTIDIAKLLEPVVSWHGAHVRDVKFLPGGKRLATATGKGAVSIWNPTSGERTEIAKPDDRELMAIGVQANDASVTTIGPSRIVAAHIIETGVTIQQFEVEQQGLRAAAFSASGRSLAVASREGDVAVYQDSDSSSPYFPDHQLFTTKKTDVAVHALTFSNDEKLLAVADDRHVVLFDAQTGQQLDDPITFASTPRSLVFCESGEVLAIGTQAGEIHLWQRGTRRIRGTIKAHSSRVNALAAFPDGKTIVSGGRDKELRLWDTGSAELLASLAGHGRQIFCITVSADGSAIASGGLAGDVWIWRGK